MLLLWSAGTRLLLLFKEDCHSSKEPSSQDRSSNRRSDRHPKRIESDDDLHAGEHSQLS